MLLTPRQQEVTFQQLQEGLSCWVSGRPDTLSGKETNNASQPEFLGWASVTCNLHVVRNLALLARMLWTIEELAVEVQTAYFLQGQ